MRNSDVATLDFMVPPGPTLQYDARMVGLEMVVYFNDSVAKNPELYPHGRDNRIAGAVFVVAELLADDWLRSIAPEYASGEWKFGYSPEPRQ